MQRKACRSGERRCIRPNTGACMCGNCRCAPTTGSTPSRWWLLCITGYLIGAPIRAFYASEAYQQYWFGWVRFIHFLCAYVYVFNFLARIYWGFVGNKYAQVEQFLPADRRRSGRRSWTSSRPTCCRPSCTGAISTGHNALAGVHLLLHLPGLCGAVHHRLRAVLQHEQFVHPADVHLDRAADGRRDERALLASPVPVVLCRVHHRPHLPCFYHDYIEGRGTISSIVGGWKFEREKSDK